MSELRFILDAPSMRTRAWRVVYALQYRWPWIYPGLPGGRRRA